MKDWFSRVYQLAQWFDPTRMLVGWFDRTWGASVAATITAAAEGSAALSDAESIACTITAAAEGSAALSDAALVRARVDGNSWFGPWRQLLQPPAVRCAVEAASETAGAAQLEIHLAFRAEGASESSAGARCAIDIPGESKAAARTFDLPEPWTPEQDEEDIQEILLLVGASLCRS
jgi:hypothetical protein